VPLIYVNRKLPFVRLNEKNYAKVCASLPSVSRKIDDALFYPYQLNRFVMSFIFLIPLTVIALYESSSNNEYKNRCVECWLRGGDDDAENSAENRNPTVDDPNCRGFEISKVSFEELVRVFPTAEVRPFFWVLFIRFFLWRVDSWYRLGWAFICTQSTEATILKEIADLKQKLDQVLEKLETR